jgi:hypothetical protein
MSFKKLHIKLVLAIVLLLCSYSGFSQTDPTDSLPGDPAALVVYTVQNLSFGSFSQGGTGGTVVVSNTGSRSTTGSLLALNRGTFHQAIFEVEVPASSIITVTNGPNATLNGSNGGSVSLAIGASSPASPFLTTAIPPARTTVNVGGTLTVGNTASSPPGNYTGTFYVTFNIQ